MSELMVEGQEVGLSEVSVSFLNPVKRNIVIHRGHQCESAGCSHEPLALRQEIEILCRISLGKGQRDVGQSLRESRLVQIRVVTTDEDLYRLLRMKRQEMAYLSDVLLVAIEKTSVVEGLIVTAADVESQSYRIVGNRCQQAVGGRLYPFIEGEEVDDVLLILQKEIIPAGIPPLDNKMTVGQHELFFMAVVVLFIMETHHGQQSHLRTVFGKEICQPVVMAGMTEVKPLIFVGKTHGNRLAAVLTSPGIDMAVLQNVIAESSFISNVYHLFVRSFLFLCLFLIHSLSGYYLSIDDLEAAVELLSRALPTVMTPQPQLRLLADAFFQHAEVDVCGLKFL